MGKMRFSIVEKKLIRTVILFDIIQLVILFIFVSLLRNSQQVNEDSVQQADIVVDDVRSIRVARENWLYVVSDSNKYLFRGRSTFEEYSVDEIENSLNRGDMLSLLYIEEWTVFGKANAVVDARSGNMIFRTIEEYNRGKENLPIILIVAFTVFELIFLGIVFVDVRMNYKIFKEIYRKIKFWRS